MAMCFSAAATAAEFIYLAHVSSRLLLSRLCNCCSLKAAAKSESVGKKVHILQEKERHATYNLTSSAFCFCCTFSWKTRSWEVSPIQLPSSLEALSYTLALYVLFPLVLSASLKIKYIYLPLH